MKTIWKTGLLAGLLLPVAVTAQALREKKLVRSAEGQINMQVANARTYLVTQNPFPRTIEGDTVRTVRSGDWTSGFFPGELWLLYELTGKASWAKQARLFTEQMWREPFNGNSHDVGFKVYNSYGQAYRLTGDTAYRSRIIQGAQTLSKRFNPVVGCIRSWDFRWQYPVIIDNMMNLELLFAATRLSGDSSFYKIAVTHANTTMRHHFRADSSSFHVVDYDTLTGAVRERTTLQGYAPGSSWARGQAWALYGYTMCYRETRDPAYLRQAEAVAGFLLRHPRLPADGVPYWDFDVPELEKEPRDASAAAIIASALFELSSYSSQGATYRQQANRILTSLARAYRYPQGQGKGFLLMHSTGHKPAKSEVDVPLIYADYYFLEAIQRRRSIH